MNGMAIATVGMTNNRESERSSLVLQCQKEEAGCDGLTCILDGIP